MKPLAGMGGQDSDVDEPSASHETHAGSAFSRNFGFSEESSKDDEDDSASEDTASDEPAEAWETRMNRPWREIVEASRMSAEEDEEENTETAIREALKAALEHPGEEDDAPTAQFPEQPRSQHEEHPRSDVSWEPFGPRDTPPTYCH